MSHKSSFWKQVFEDDNGTPSSTRVLVAGLVVYSLMAATLILSIWAYLSLTSMTFIPLGIGEVSTLATSVLAICFKVLNKKYELRDDDFYCKRSNGRKKHEETTDFEPTMFKEPQNGQE